MNYSEYTKQTPLTAGVNHSLWLLSKKCMPTQLVDHHGYSSHKRMTHTHTHTKAKPSAAVNGHAARWPALGHLCTTQVL